MTQAAASPCCSRTASSRRNADSAGVTWQRSEGVDIRISMLDIRIYRERGLIHVYPCLIYVYEALEVCDAGGRVAVLL